MNQKISSSPVPFGIYRPLSHAYATKVAEAISNAAADINEYVKREEGCPPARFSPRNVFGITYLSQRAVGEALQEGLVENGFEYEIVGKLQTYCDEIADESAALPVTQLDISGNGHSKLISAINASASAALWGQLRSEASCFQAYINAGYEEYVPTGDKLLVMAPNHLTYGVLRVLGSKGRGGIPFPIAREVSKIARNRLKESHITELVFGKSWATTNNGYVELEQLQEAA